MLRPVNDPRMKFGIRLRQLREEKGFSQEYLAELCEMHRTYIGSIERGERNVSLINIHKLADGLGCSVTDLLVEPKK